MCQPLPTAKFHRPASVPCAPKCSHGQSSTRGPPRRNRTHPKETSPLSIAIAHAPCENLRESAECRPQFVSAPRSSVDAHAISWQFSRRQRPSPCACNAPAGTSHMQPDIFQRESICSEFHQMCKNLNFFLFNRRSLNGGSGNPSSQPSLRSAPPACRARTHRPPSLQFVDPFVLWFPQFEGPSPCALNSEAV